MSTNKIVVLLPDGIGLRNFAYSSCYDLGKSPGFGTIFWNNTPFDLTDFGFKIKSGITKFMLREMVSEYLTDDLIFAPKKALQTAQMEMASRRFKKVGKSMF